MNNLLDALRYSFEISPPEIEIIIKTLNEEMEKGLLGEPSSVLMLPSFVEPPTGNEKGKFLALDFGGTNLRVLSLSLEGNGKTSEPIMENYPIKKNLQSSNKEELFDFIASAIVDFLQKHQTSDTAAQNLGFTFSFAFNQTGVTSSKLISWSKEFAVMDAIGEDVVELLRLALKRKEVANIKIAALANDSVGVLAKGRYQNSNCDISMVLGTGVNIAYVEDTAKIKKTGIADTFTGKMMINTECCEFTKMKQADYDFTLDKTTENPGEAILEKMVSGKYLGVLAGIIILDIWDKKEFSYSFDLYDRSSLRSLDSQAMSEIISDISPNLNLVNTVAANVGIVGATQGDRQMLKEVCQIIFNRSARIAAAALASIILKIDPKLEQPHTVAFDGSLYEKAFGYKESLLENLNTILGAKTSKITFVLAKDGSGIGAAIVAAAALH